MPLREHVLGKERARKGTLRLPARKTQPEAPGRGTAPVIHETERAVLGAAIRDSNLAEIVSSELDRSDFYTVDTQSAYTSIHSLLEDNLAVSPVALAERSGLPKTAVEELLEAGQGIGQSELNGLISELRRVSGLRAVYNACTNASSAISKSSKLDEVVEALEKSLYSSNRTGITQGATDGAEEMSKVVDEFMHRYQNGGGPEISTGLVDLDRAIIGLRPGKMGVIAARPSMGKTALASTIRRAVLQQGYGVIEFALEMSSEELLERELAYQAQTNLRKILSAKEVTPDEYGRIQSARGALFPGRWFIDDATYSIGGMRRKARVLAGRMARQSIKTGLVIVDYLQLAGDGGELREQSIAAVSRGCKFLAKELGCTVLALSQLNRSCEYREDRRPLMSDLRESGSIEQDADWVGFVYREHMYDNSFPAEECEFIIRKQRSGPTGTVRLSYMPKLVSFKDLAKEAKANESEDGGRQRDADRQADQARQ